MLQTTKEWQDSVSSALQNMTEEMKKLGIAIMGIMKNEVVKESSTTEKALPKQVADVEMPDTEFEKRMWFFAYSQLLIFVMFTLVSFYYIQSLFGFWFGLSASAFIFLDMLMIDKYALKGDSLGKVSKNPVAVVGFWAVIAFVFVFCFAIGNTLISDPVRGEEYKQPSIERQYKDIDSIAPENGDNEFGNSGSSER